jgi:hypothetical protein
MMFRLYIRKWQTPDVRFLNEDKFFNAYKLWIYWRVESSRPVIINLHWLTENKDKPSEFSSDYIKDKIFVTMLCKLDMQKP